MAFLDVDVAPLTAESRSRPRADAASSFLLSPAHPSPVQPLSAHSARPVAAVPWWIPLKAFSLKGQLSHSEFVIT